MQLYNSSSIKTFKFHGSLGLPSGGSESQGFISRWFIMEGSWIFLGFHGLVGVGAFCLKQFEISHLVGIRPYNALAFTGPIITSFQSLLFIPVKPVGSSVPVSA